jgi:hypothetical protein
MTRAVVSCGGRRPTRCLPVGFVAPCEHPSPCSALTAALALASAFAQHGPTAKNVINHEPGRVLRIFWDSIARRGGRLQSLVTDVFGGHDEEDVFGDVGRVVADAFEMPGDQHQLERR